MVVSKSLDSAAVASVAIRLRSQGPKGKRETSVKSLKRRGFGGYLLLLLPACCVYSGLEEQQLLKLEGDGHIGRRGESTLCNFGVKVWTGIQSGV